MNADEFWILGEVFLNGYYSVFDNSIPTSAKLGIAPHKTSTKDQIMTGSLPLTESIQWELTWLFDIYWFFNIPGFIDLYNIYQFFGEGWISIFGVPEL